METVDQRMDATWGRAKYRTEVWEDDVNPMNEWWLAYAPSEEEVAAAEQGFDFKNPSKWFEVSNHCTYYSENCFQPRNLTYSSVTRFRLRESSRRN